MNRVVTRSRRLGIKSRPGHRRRPGSGAGRGTTRTSPSMMLRLAFGRPWRQTEGLLGSMLDLLGLELSVPDHTTFSRRSVDLGVATALKKADGPVHVMIDST